MDISRLRYFTVIVETGSLVKASELLHISQPALSKAMKVLQIELNTKLFTQSGRGLVVTDKGRKIALQAREIIRDLDLIGQEASMPESNCLKVGSFEVFTTHLIGPLVQHYFPDSEIELQELTPGKLEESLANHTIDFGITYLPIPHSALDFQEITQTKMIIAAKTGSFKGQDFNDLPFVVPTIPIVGSPSKVKGLDGWPDDRIPRKIQYKVAMMESALELCRRGKAVAYLPEFVVRLHNSTVKPELALKEISSPLKVGERKQPIYLLKRKSDTESANHKRLAKALRQLI